MKSCLLFKKRIYRRYKVSTHKNHHLFCFKYQTDPTSHHLSSFAVYLFRVVWSCHGLLANRRRPCASLWRRLAEFMYKCEGFQFLLQNLMLWNFIKDDAVSESACAQFHAGYFHPHANFLPRSLRSFIETLKDVMCKYVKAIPSNNLHCRIRICERCPCLLSLSLAKDLRERLGS